MSNGTASQSPSRLVYALAEAPRVLHEMAHLSIARRWLHRAPQGDGHGVMLLPGFLGSDKYNRPLLEYLESLGYIAVGWEQGVNTGPAPEVVEGLFRQLQRLHARSGGKVSLIGHSLGGVYAREMAREFPDQVRQVISLGSPIGEHRDSATPTSKLYQRLNPNAGQAERRENIVAVPPVPTSAVFSRTDGVVPWTQSIQKNGHRQTENIEVQGSHCGLTVNAAVWYFLAERLAQPEDEWQPVARTGWRRLVYPRCFERELQLH